MMKLFGLIKRLNRKCGIIQFILMVTFILVHFSAIAQSGPPLRRPVSPAQPMWLIHIDSWNNADPQKIIDLIPMDIRPFVVFNISLSISHDANGKWDRVEYGYETIKSWLRTCSENRVWAMVQQSSGGFAHFSDYDLSVYEHLYRDYPCLIGFNYAEQFWGFGDPYSVPWTDRMAHFADLLKLSNKYGGYLTVSWCGTQYSPSINPIAMLKRNPKFAVACKQFSKNFILCDKYTTDAYKLDMESICLGTYLSGFSGHYGIRYDQSGWSDSTGVNANFTMATALAPYLEHAMLSGATVIDGPELIWEQQSKEVATRSAKDGYNARAWKLYPQFFNVTCDVFRKVLDGTIRIPDRQEVINRSKLAIVQDVTTGNQDDIYSTPETLFTGLYQMDADGVYQNNKTFFKKTGRYATIPVIYKAADGIGRSFEKLLNASSLAERWPTLKDKVDAFDQLFEQEYTGDLFVGRNENKWVLYNPFKTNQIAKASIPFKFNSCDSMQVAFAQYSAGAVTERNNELLFYLNNYDNLINTGLKTDSIRIYGCTKEPSWSFVDRADHQQSVVTAHWSDGIFSLIIKHNGALDITVNCQGTATGRLSSFHVSRISAPRLPAVYSGPRQYEAEFFDYKNITGVVADGVQGAVRHYTGQGYLNFGTSSSASIRTRIGVPVPGTYIIKVKYAAPVANVHTIDFLVNGVKGATPLFSQTPTVSDWRTAAVSVQLKAGDNTVEMRSGAATGGEIYFDHIVVSAVADAYSFESDTAQVGATNPPAYYLDQRCGTAGVVSFTDAGGLTSHVLKPYTGGEGGELNAAAVADLSLFPVQSDYQVTWKMYGQPDGGSLGILMRGTKSCAYAKGMQQGYLFMAKKNADHSVNLETYIAADQDITLKSSFTTSFALQANEPIWLRASTTGGKISFECSKDSISWEGADLTAFTDYRYSGGTSQLIWTMGATNAAPLIDNITCQAATISVNKFKLNGFSYVQGAGPSRSLPVVVTGSSLQADVIAKAPDHFEISLDSLSGFHSELTLPTKADSIATTKIFVRLQQGLSTGHYAGRLNFSGLRDSDFVALDGSVSLSKSYSFDGDSPSSTPADPPAADLSVGLGNSLTAGVIAYTDAKNTTNHYLKIYGVGSSANGTGVLNFDLFGTNNMDYAITWKQAVPDSTKQYKNGVLLRGSDKGGYTEGIMQGYLFNASNSGPSSVAFRIFKSTAAGIGSPLASANAGSDLHLSNDVPIWFRASVAGSKSVVLKFEYSLDSINWHTVTTYIDNMGTFKSGATQFVSGLYASGNQYYLDNITLSTTPSPAELSVHYENPENCVYLVGNGPSNIQRFSLNATHIQGDMVIKAPPTFEMALDSTGSYATSLVLPKQGDLIDTTNIFVRLKAGLFSGHYQGNISFGYAQQSSPFDEVVVLHGTVSKPDISAVALTTLNDLGYVLPTGTSTVRAVHVAGSQLTDHIMVTASTGFGLCLSPAGIFTNNIVIEPVNDTVLPTTVYVRLLPGLAAGDYTGHIQLSATGADDKQLAVHGIVLSSARVASSILVINGLGYNTHANTAPVKSFFVWGKPLSGQLTLTAPQNFEISRSRDADFSSQINLPAHNGYVDSTIIYARLKTGLTAGQYTGDLAILSPLAPDLHLDLKAEVSSALIYDFTSDKAGSSQSTPPALNMLIGAGNTAGAGVVDFGFGPADNQQFSHCLRAYSGGNRNATGVIDLNLFPQDASNYSLTWKQALGSFNANYKVGALLRGGSVVGVDGSTGYVQGIKAGYLFIVYNENSGSNTHAEFRIYKSTSATNLALMVNNNSVTSLVPVAGQPIWYRASVSGTTDVQLNFEYSLDSIHWNLGAQTSDHSDVFSAGSTQLVWGLAAASYNFYLDDIAFQADNEEALPIGFTAFSASALDRRVLLQWKTAFDPSAIGFSIERGVDRHSFRKIGYTAAAQGAGLNPYQFYDQSPLLGENYYRIKQQLSGGGFAYSQTKSVMYTPSQVGIQSYPNPAGGILYIEGALKAGRLKVYTLQGVLVLQTDIKQGIKNKVDISRLPPGLYFYKINNYQGKFIKK